MAIPGMSVEDRIIEEKAAELQKFVDDQIKDHIRRQEQLMNQSEVDPYVTITRPGALTGTAPDVEREYREWLDQTQPMRVVALDEATKFITAVIESRPSATLDYRDILSAAQAFAKFLNEGKVK